ncbi:MAG: D-alanyl-D-alanine carboxypeptidase [Alphaproteobacteria bacterium]|nr:D-alanyl-D-alanine carboxypeptidase [Alphaproteobacteria bacterium]
MAIGKHIIRLLLLITAFSLPLHLFAGTACADERKAELIVDATNGKILYQKYAGETRYPASLTKMMTLYLVFDALKTGKLAMGQMLAVSEKAAEISPLKLGLKAGSRVSVEDVVLGMIVLSANDAAVVAAEALGGSEWQFAKQMTLTARKLGMNNTVFKNASGLPDDEQITTAYDLAILAMAIQRNHPEYYPLFSRTGFIFKGRRIKGHNRVLQHYRGAEGLKTGFIRASGYNLVTTARRNGFSLIGVVMGGDSIQSRDDKMIVLMNQGFNTLYANKHSDNPTYSAHNFGAPQPIDRNNVTLQTGKDAVPSDDKSDADANSADPEKKSKIASQSKIEKTSYKKKTTIHKKKSVKKKHKKRKATKQTKPAAAKQKSVSNSKAPKTTPDSH